MQVSDLIAGLNNISQVAGGADVQLRHADTGEVTELVDIDIKVSVPAGQSSGTVYLEHGTPPAAPAQPTPQVTPDEPAATDPAPPSPA